MENESLKNNASNFVPELNAFLFKNIRVHWEKNGKRIFLNNTRSAERNLKMKNLLNSDCTKREKEALASKAKLQIKTFLFISFYSGKLFITNCIIVVHDWSSKKKSIAKIKSFSEKNPNNLESWTLYRPHTEKHNLFLNQVLINVSKVEGGILELRNEGWNGF